MRGTKLITRIILLHESGVPIYAWPVDDESVSLLSSFLSAIHQFSKTYFSQSINLIGLDKENILFVRKNAYILVLSFIDRSSVSLIEFLANKLTKNLDNIFKADFEELQLDQNIDKIVTGALDSSGITWLHDLATYVLKTESVMGLSIFRIDKEQITPLYTPVEPFLGFSKITQLVFSAPKIINLATQTLGSKPRRILVIARNNNGIEMWLGGELLAVIEHSIEDKNATRESGEKVSDNADLLRNTVSSLALDILGDYPEYSIIETKKGKYEI